jgi:hypothetical protein
MAESKNVFCTFCLGADELQLLEFAARESGMTKSSFCYVLLRDKLRALGLLPPPTLPPALAARAAASMKDNSNAQTNGNANAG